MSFIASSNISVFPSARRMNKQVSARLISEASLANIVNKLIETDGFVITPEPEEGDHVDQGFDPEQAFEFNVYGYYFKVNQASDILDLFNDNSTTEIYANIYLDRSTDPNYVELAGQDDYINEAGYEQGILYYKGLTFSNSNLSEAETTPADYSLLLFERDYVSGVLTDWFVPVESRLKFIYTIALGVDGGEIMRGDTSV